MARPARKQRPLIVLAEVQVCKLGALCGDLFEVIDRISSEITDYDHKRDLTYVKNRLAEMRERLI